jgi:hypothetical protein
MRPRTFTHCGQNRKSSFRGEYAIGIFLDIKGAFDSIKTTSVIDSMKRHSIPEYICKWYEQYLTNRFANVEVGGFSISAKLNRGIPQGGVASPVMAWNLTFDQLLEGFDFSPTDSTAFVDDGALVTVGIDFETVRSLSQSALNKAWQWADEHGLKLCKKKTTAIIFTRKLDLKNRSLTKLKLEDSYLPYKQSVKYLMDSQGFLRLLASSKMLVAITTAIVAKRVPTKMVFPKAGSSTFNLPNILATSLALWLLDVKNFFNNHLILDILEGGTYNVIASVSIKNPKYSFLCEEDPKESDLSNATVNPALSKVPMVRL